MSVSNFSSASTLFQPFQFLALRTVRQVPIESLPPISAAIQRELDDKEWLLESGQHVTFPPTLLDEMANQRIFTASDFVSIIEKATNDDLQAAAFDPDTGKRKQLNSDQWNEMKLTGEVSVPSVMFEHQHHRWKLAQGFYSGVQTIRESFSAGFGKVLDHWIVYTPRSLLGRQQSYYNRWSLLGSLRFGSSQALSTLAGALDQIWGSPLQHPKYSSYTIDTILESAENAYVIYHMKNENLNAPHWISHFISLDTFQDKDIWNVLEKDAASWDKAIRPTESDFQHQRDAFKMIEAARQEFEQVMQAQRSTQLNLRVEKTLSSPKAAMTELRHAESDWRQQMETAWKEELLNSSHLGVIGKVEANQVQARHLGEKLRKEDADAEQRDIKAYQTGLQKEYPILSTSTEWMQYKVSNFAEKLISAMDASRPGRLAIKLREANLFSPAREQELREEFQAKLKKTIQKQLQSHHLPCPDAEFQVPVFNPGEWHLSNDLYLTQHTSAEFGAGYFRRISFNWLTVMGHVKRDRLVHVHVGDRFWRIRYTQMNFLSSTKSYFGGFYHFLLSGPFSLRALLSKDPFFAYKRIKSNTTETCTLMGGEREHLIGTLDLEDDPSSFTPTLYSRLVSFYESLAEVRTRFEATPDTGLIGKHVQRFFVRGYLLVTSTVGTTIITSVMVVCSLVATAVTSVGVLLAPVLAIATVLVETMFHILVYDVPQNAAAQRSQKYIYNGAHWLQHGPAEPNSLGPAVKMVVQVPFEFLITGCLTAAFASFRGVVYHPLMGTFQLIWTSFRQGSRLVRDVLTWNLVIRQAAKVPAADTFLAKRIHGPGLASEYYYRIPLESAQMSVRLLLDSNRIHAYTALQKEEIMEPFGRYDNLFHASLTPFGIKSECAENDPNTAKVRIIREWFQKRAALGSALPTTTANIENVDRGLPVPNELFDDIGQRVRSANPDHIKLQSEVQREAWEKRDAVTNPLQMDKEIADSLKELTVTETDVSRQYKLMAARAGHLLAEISLRQNIRDSSIVKLTKMPRQSKGRVRMSASELDQLWKNTIQQTEDCLLVLEQELLQYAQNSVFADVLVPKAQDIMNGIFTSVGGRPGVDIPLVAVDILTKLFGADAINNALEDVDQTLVLLPKRSELDRHLDFGIFGNSPAWNGLYE